MPPDEVRVSHMVDRRNLGFVSERGPTAQPVAEAWMQTKGHENSLMVRAADDLGAARHNPVMLGSFWMRSNCEW
jgi:hypothetical protein